MGFSTQLRSLPASALLKKKSQAGTKKTHERRDIKTNNFLHGFKNPRQRKTPTVGTLAALLARPIVLHRCLPAPTRAPKTGSQSTLNTVQRSPAYGATKPLLGEGKR